MKLTRGPMRDVGLDISVKSAKAGRCFAPTWDMVLGYKRGTISKFKYMLEYTHLLSKLNKQIFIDLAKKDRHLKCYCANGEFCHTYLLIYHCLTNYPELFTTDQETKLVINSLIEGFYKPI